MTECSVCGWRHTSGNCGKDGCPRPVERTPCEHLYDIACRELDEVRAQRDEMDKAYASLSHGAGALRVQRDELLATLKDVELVINPRDIGGISMHEWGSRLRVATSRILEVVAKYEGK
jgi:hypothetical protein